MGNTQKLVSHTRSTHTRQFVLYRQHESFTEQTVWYGGSCVGVIRCVNHLDLLIISLGNRVTSEQESNLGLIDDYWPRALGDIICSLQLTFSGEIQHQVRVV